MTWCGAARAARGATGAALRGAACGAASDAPRCAAAAAASVKC